MIGIGESRETLKDLGDIESGFVIAGKSRGGKWISCRTLFVSLSLSL